MPSAAAVKELLSARAQRREDVLEVRCRGRNPPEGGRIDRATSRGEERDGGDAAHDLEAATGDVLVRDMVCCDMQDGPQEQRKHARVGCRPSRGAGCDMQADDHTRW